MSTEEAAERRTGVGPNRVQLHPAFCFSVVIMRTVLSPFFVFPLLGILTQLLDTSMSRREVRPSQCPSERGQPLVTYDFSVSMHVFALPKVPDVVRTLLFLTGVFCFYISSEWYNAWEVRHTLDGHAVGLTHWMYFHEENGVFGKANATTQRDKSR